MSAKRVVCPDCSQVKQERNMTFHKLTGECEASKLERDLRQEGLVTLTGGNFLTVMLTAEVPFRRAKTSFNPVHRQTFHQTWVDPWLRDLLHRTEGLDRAPRAHLLQLAHTDPNFRIKALAIRALGGLNALRATARNLFKSLSPERKVYFRRSVPKTYTTAGLP